MGPVDIRAQYAAERRGGELARKIGKPAGEWTEDDLVLLVESEKIRILCLMHVDGEGELRALDFLPRSEAHLREILRAGERADGSSLFPGAGLPPDASDIVLRPKLPTAFLDPFSEIPTLAILCSHHDREGAPLAQSPDTIVRRAAERFRAETGTELLAHAEVEFFLGKAAEEEDVYGSSERGYHATSPFVFGEDLRRQTMVILGDIGVAVKYGHAEVGYIGAEEGGGYIWEQHEIELALAPLPIAAEAVALTQWALRNLSHASSIQCSFRLVLRAGHAGSGMHFHFAILGDQGFASMDGPSTELAQALVGGLVRSGGGLMAFGNRSRESFLRLQQGKEVPASITWGHFNRKALVRIPVLARSAEGEPVAPPTVEFRLPDGSVNPFLLLAGAAQAVVQASGDPGIAEFLETSRALRPTGSPGQDASGIAPGRFPIAAGIGPAGDDSAGAAGTPGAAPSGVVGAGEAGAAPDGATPTAATVTGVGNTPVRTLPLSFPAIAEALELQRESLGAGDVFPDELLVAALQRLRRDESG